MFCGWDWGSTIHGVCLLDDDGVTIKTWTVKHTDTELAALFAELAQLGDPALIPVSIERGEGLVVGLIARAGHPVLMVEPAAFKASRPRWGAAGAKSDAADAFMLADYARTDGHRLRRVEPLAQATRELAAWSGHGPPWSRHAPQRPTSCGPSSPSTGQALGWSSRS